MSLTKIPYAQHVFYPSQPQPPAVINGVARPSSLPAYGMGATPIGSSAQDWISFQRPVPAQPMSNGQLTPSSQAQIYYNLGERYYQANRFHHAIEAFSESVRLNPTDYRAFNKRGVAKATIKDYVGAFSDYSRAIALQPHFYNAYINRGNLWVYLGEIARKKGSQVVANQSNLNALNDFSQAILINPTNGVAYENRSELYGNLGMHSQALQDKAKAIQIQHMKRRRPFGLPFCPPRIALVLANDDYDGVKNDLNGGPMRDASKMVQKLRSQGFQVITGANLTGPQTKAKVAEFITRLNENPNAISLTYYSGHGGAIDGNNYIIPTDYAGEGDPKLAQDAVSVDYLLKQLKATNSYFNMIFLDACRTPLPEGNTAFKSGKRNLKSWETEPGPGLSNTWIEYASRPNKPAMQDNNEGLYTKYLLQFMDRPDLNLKEVSMYTSYALESDPMANRENQHARTQTDLSRTEPIAEAFRFASHCPSPASVASVSSGFQTAPVQSGQLSIMPSPQPFSPNVTSPPYPLF